MSYTLEFGEPARPCQSASLSIVMETPQMAMEEIWVGKSMQRNVFILIMHLG